MTASLLHCKVFKGKHKDQISQLPYACDVYVFHLYIFNDRLFLNHKNHHKICHLDRQFNGIKLNTCFHLIVEDNLVLL